MAHICGYSETIRGTRRNALIEFMIIVSSCSSNMSFPATSSQPWNWGSFQSSFPSLSNSGSNSVSNIAPSNNTQPQAYHSVAQHQNANPYIVIPVPVPVPAQQSSEPTRLQSYHMSFINNENPLNVRLTNNRTHTITTNMVGKGTKFECEIPIDQNVDVAVTVLTNNIPIVTESIGIVAQVDNDPFGLRRLGQR